DEYGTRHGVRVRIARELGSQAKSSLGSSMFHMASIDYCGHTLFGAHMRLTPYARLTPVRASVTREVLGLSSPSLRESANVARRMKHVREFRDAYAETIRWATPYENVGGGSGFYGPSSGQREEFERRLANLAELAGAAHAAALPL